MIGRLIIFIVSALALATPVAKASWWNDFDANGLDARVRSLGNFGDVLVVGGDFANAGTTPANFIATWDGDTWSALGSGVDDDVHALGEHVRLEVDTVLHAHERFFTLRQRLDRPQHVVLDPHRAPLGDVGTLRRNLRNVVPGLHGVTIRSGS